MHANCCNASDSVSLSGSAGDRANFRYRRRGICEPRQHDGRVDDWLAVFVAERFARRGRRGRRLQRLLWRHGRVGVANGGTSMTERRPLLLYRRRGRLCARRGWRGRRRECKPHSRAERFGRRDTVGRSGPGGTTKPFMSSDRLTISMRSPETLATVSLTWRAL